LDQQGAEKDYQALQEALGRRPTLTEYYHFGASLTQTRRQHGSWFGLLRDVGDLTATEQHLTTRHERFLTEVETTDMNKSFKMILLQAFQQLNGWQSAPTLAQLAES